MNSARFKLWWHDDSLETDSKTLTSNILKLIILLPIIVVGIVFWPITALIMLIRWLYGKKSKRSIMPDVSSLKSPLIYEPAKYEILNEMVHNASVFRIYFRNPDC